MDARLSMGIAFALVGTCLQGQDLLAALDARTIEPDPSARRAMTLDRQPMAIEVITAETIRDRGFTTLKEVLAYARSVYVLDYDGGMVTLGMRGILQQGQPRNVKILVDGMAMENPMLGSADIDNLPIPLVHIQRIEVCPGPNSVLYGANAVGGVINVVTRRGKGGELSYLGGTKRESRAQGFVGLNAAGWNFTASAAIHSRGPSGYVSHLMGTPSALVPFDESHPNSVHGHQTWLRAERSFGASKVWAQGGASNKMMGPEGNLPWTRTANQALQAGYAVGLSSNLVVSARMDQVTKKLWGGAAPILVKVMGDPGWATNYQWGDIATTQAALELEWQVAETLRLNAGADSRRTNIAPCVFQGILETFRLTGSGGYAIGEWSPHSSLRISLGLRAENETLGGARTSPRLGVSWSTGVGVFRAGYFSAIRSPQVLEQFSKATLILKAASNPPTDPRPVLFQIRSNPGIQPEKIDSVEVGWRFQGTSGLQVDMSCFYMVFRELIQHTPLTTEQLPAPPYPRIVLPSWYTNRGKAKDVGLELSLTQPLPGGLELGANATFINYFKTNPSPTDPIGNRFAYAPRSRMAAWIRSGPGARLVWSLGLRHLSATDVEAVLVYGYPTYEQRAAQTQVDAYLGYRWQGFEAGLTAWNALKEYTPMGATGTGRPAEFNAERRVFGLRAAYRF